MPSVQNALPGHDPMAPCLRIGQRVLRGGGAPEAQQDCGAVPGDEALGVVQPLPQHLQVLQAVQRHAHLQDILVARVRWFLVGFGLRVLGYGGSCWERTMRRGAPMLTRECALSAHAGCVMCRGDVQGRSHQTDGASSEPQQAMHSRKTDGAPEGHSTPPAPSCGALCPTPSSATGRAWFGLLRRKTDRHGQTDREAGRQAGRQTDR
jgi:hypothetical protein